MATTDETILKFLLKVENQGTLKEINNLKSLKEQAQALSSVLDQLTKKYQDLSLSRAKEVLQSYSKTAASDEGKLLGVEPINNKALDLGYEMAFVSAQELKAKTAVQDIMSALQKATAPGTTPYQQVKNLAPLLLETSKATGVTTAELLKLSAATLKIDPTVVKDTTKALHGMKNGIVDNIKEMFNLRAIMQTAFGVFMAMIIFQLQMMITQFFTDVIQQAKDFSNALAKLGIAEQVMSASGTNVTGKELMDLVDALGEKFKNVSKVDMLKATAETALQMAALGISTKELQGLMETALAAQIRNPGKQLDEIMSTLSAGVMSGQVKGVQNLGGGLSISEEVVKKYALEQGIISDINDTLTEQQKIHARTGVLIEQNNKSLDDTLQIQDNLANSGDKLNASMENLKIKFAPLVDIWNAFLYLLSYAINGMVLFAGILDGSVKPANKFQEVMAAIVKYIWSVSTVIVQVLVAPIRLAVVAAEQLLKLYEKLSGQKVSEQPTIANLNKQDTPTSGSPGTGDGPLSDSSTSNAKSNADKIRKAIHDVAAAMKDFAQKAADAEEKFRISMQQMAEDFAVSYNRAMQDWMHDRAKIVADANDKLAKKEADYQQKKKDKEARFLLEMKQLREKFMLDLEDALYAQDARAVLKLARNYAMEKKNKTDEFNLGAGQDAAAHAQDMADMAKERNDRLAELNYERALKLRQMQEDYALRVKRAKQEHEIEMQRLAREREDKLRELAETLAEQLNLNEQGVSAIFNLYKSYFGSGGGIDNLMKFQYKNTVAYANAMAKELDTIMKKYQAVSDLTGETPSVGGSTTTKSVGGRANGGLDIANTPTTATFGDNGAEAHLFVPLNKLSTLAGGISSSAYQNGVGSSKIELEVLLSKDLEARIINTSLDEMAQTVMRVRRSQG